MAAELGPTLGALLVGVVVGGILYGITCAQTWIYFRNSDKDSLWIKGIVWATWITDTVNQILIIQGLYVYLIQDFGNFKALGTLIPSNLIEAIFNLLTSMFVKSFFAWRIWVVSRKSVIIIAIIVLLMIAEFTFGIIFIVRALQLGNFALLFKIEIFDKLDWIFAAVNDLIISCALIFYLHRSPAHFSRSKLILDRLIYWAVGTGLITSASAFAVLITFITKPNDEIYIALYFFTGRFYVNALLANLNSRSIIRDTVDSKHTAGTSFSIRTRTTTHPTREDIVFKSTPQTYKGATTLADAETQSVADMKNHSMMPSMSTE